MPEPFPKRITQPFNHPVSIPESGLYSIFIIASCRSGKQIKQYGGEDLRVEIDNTILREIPGIARKQQYDIPPTWSGTQLQGKTKTVIFILRLQAGAHTLKFFPYRGSEITNEPKIKKLSDPRNISFPLEAKAETGDRRPWYTVILIDLPLKTFTVDATIHGRFQDSDDVKIIIDGRPKENLLSKKYRWWHWAGSILRKLSGQAHQKETFTENLRRGDHYIELWADRQPTLHNIELDLGVMPRVPTVDDPEWTGDFKDDTEQMMLARAIFGEARDQNLSDQVRIGIAWSIRHRVEDPRWGDTYNKVITQKEQYSAFNEDDKNWEYVKNPLHAKNAIDQKMWLRCYEIAGQVMQGEAPNPINGANHYYDISIETPRWAESAEFIIQINTVRFYKL